ncbi:MAG: pyruvate synthase subunit beta [Deltaproteobacteria bacterium]|nr:pyruvate synthase subunit beta [Deltaproteobacteria bacterium]
MKENTRWNWHEPRLLDRGHAFCAGCGGVLALRHVLRALGEDTIAVITAGCVGTNSGVFPSSPIRVACYNTPFPSLAAAASGVRAALNARRNDHTRVLAVGGDGGTFDIGLQGLSAAAERNDDFVLLCYDNEAYMNTGIQRSSATPQGAWTTITPQGNLKGQPKKNLTRIIMAHNVPYVATASVGYPEDLIAKAHKAAEIRGFRFLHVISPCPPGWGFSPQHTIRLARLAVRTRIFPLFEVFGGERIMLSMDPEPVPVVEYLRMQNRFQYISEEDIQQIQRTADRAWQRLAKEADRTAQPA